MLTVKLAEVQLIEETSEIDSRHSLRFGFPLTSAEGTASTTTVYFEIDPGKRLSRHRDSAEEVLVVLEGTAQATIGDETAVAETGSIVVVPAMEPHEVANVGDGPLRVLGVFSSSTVVSTFDEPVTEGGEQIFVTGAPVPLAAHLPTGAATV